MKIRLIFFLFIPYCLFSQDLSIEIGSVSSDFRYLNSEGATLDYFVKDPSLSLGFDWSQNIRNRSSKLLMGLHYQELRSNAIENRAPIDYKTQFLSYRMGFNQDILEYYINPYCKNCDALLTSIFIGMEGSKLISGSQTIDNSEVYNLMKQPEFNHFFLGPLAALKLQYSVGFSSSLQFSYTAAYWLNTYRGAEQLNFFNQTISIGIKRDL